MRTGAGAGVLPARLRETCRIARGRVPLWPYHRIRLASGGCPAEQLAEIERAVDQAASCYPDAGPGERFRLTVVVTPAPEAIDADSRTQPHRQRPSIEVVRRMSSLDVPNGPTIARVDVDRLPRLPPGAAKPADRSYWDAAHRTARARRAHQAVLVGPEYMVVDGSTATIWAVEGATLVTPPSPPAVAGVARAFLLANASASGLEALVEPLSWQRLEDADELLLTNAFGGAVGVRGRGGARVQRVRELFAALWAGEL